MSAALDMLTTWLPCLAVARSQKYQADLEHAGSSTTRKTNPVAWERGLVIAQCGNCEAWHKLSDAGGLVEEVRFDQEEPKA